MPSLAAIIEKIDQQAEELKRLLPLKPEDQQKLDKKFRLEFNFNSNHLEGNTLTYGETELLLLFDQTKGGHELREYEEMKSHDVALKMVQEEASDIERPLTEQFIRQLNERLLVRPFYKEAITPDGQQTRKQVIPGQYKSSPNSVRLQNGEVFHYAAPDEVPALMSELVEWYNKHHSTEHPLILASLLHYRFVRIHPFDDGNGRVARLLMNYVLLKQGYPMVVIKSLQKKNYLAALNRADVGDIEAFTEYIGKELLWSFDMWLKAAKGESIEEDDDLDKELSILKRQLNQQADLITTKRSKEAVLKVIDTSFFPMIRGLDEKITIIQDEFLEFSKRIEVTHLGQRGAIILESDIDFNLYNDWLNRSYTDNSAEIEKLKYEIALKGLKKSNTDSRFYCSILVDFQEYHYVIKDGLNPKNELAMKPYGVQLTSVERKQIIKQYLSKIIKQIKIASNLS